MTMQSSSTPWPSTSVATCIPMGIESLWSMLKRAHKGTFHKLSPKQP